MIWYYIQQLFPFCLFYPENIVLVKSIPHNKIQVFSNFELNETETLLRYKVCLINASLKLLFLSQKQIAQMLHVNM